MSFLAIASFDSYKTWKYDTRASSKKIRTKISTGTFTKYNCALFEHTNFTIAFECGAAQSRKVASYCPGSCQEKKTLKQASLYSGNNNLWRAR